MDIHLPVLLRAAELFAAQAYKLFRETVLATHHVR